MCGLGSSSAARRRLDNFLPSLAGFASSSVQLTGFAQFTLLGSSPTVGLVPLGTPINIGSLSPGESFITSFLFEPPSPCLTLQASCKLGFGFDGSVEDFRTFAFAQLSDADPFPSSAPTIPIAILFPLNPCSQTCQASGPIVANDSPVEVGGWNVTIAQTPVPSALALFFSGFGLLSWLGCRRRRKNAAAVDIGGLQTRRGFRRATISSG
jgi:hypothetical protein